VLAMDKDLALLHEKIDYLTEQLEEQRKRQQALEELKNDMIPIANHMVKLTIDELAEIGNEFQLEDLLFLLKRLLRNTPLLLQMMDRLEALSALGDEAGLLGKQIFASSVETLDRMEREGYFAFAREGWRMTERIVAEFGEEDARALADNVVTILTTVRNMTQPDIMALANNAVEAIRVEEGASENGKNPSALTLLREMNDPKVRKGMLRMLNMVKALADSSESPSVN
jgi:uncharacterized protein YjgD (DUF1641 family)